MPHDPSVEGIKCNTKIENSLIKIENINKLISFGDTKHLLLDFAHVVDYLPNYTVKIITDKDGNIKPSEINKSVPSSSSSSIEDTYEYTYRLNSLYLSYDYINYFHDYSNMESIKEKDHFSKKYSIIEIIKDDKILTLNQHLMNCYYYLKEINEFEGIKYFEGIKDLKFYIQKDTDEFQEIKVNIPIPTLLNSERMDNPNDVVKLLKIMTFIFRKDILINHVELFKKFICNFVWKNKLKKFIKINYILDINNIDNIFLQNIWNDINNIDNIFLQNIWNIVDNYSGYIVCENTTDGENMK